MKNDIIKRLTDSIMNERQAKIYYVLIKNNDATASELHRNTGIPLNKTYETLKTLTRYGYCSQKKIENKILYSPIEPIVSFDRIIEEKRQQLDEINEIKIEMQEIFKSSPDQNELSEYIEVIQGNLNVHKKYVELINKTNHSILGTSCPPFAVINNKQVTEQIKTMKDFFARGGKDKTVREINQGSPTFVFNALKELTRSTQEENRITPQCPIKLYIFDDETLMTFNSSFMQDDDELCASIIKQPNTVKTYVQMFNFLWDQAETVEDWMNQNTVLLEQKLSEYQTSK